MVQHNLGVHCFQILVCQFEFLGPRRWHVHKQPLLSHSAWCNIGFSSHQRRRPGFPGHIKDNLVLKVFELIDVWNEVRVVATICCRFLVLYFCWIWKGRHCPLWNIRDWQWSPGEGNTFGSILSCRFRARTAILACCGRMGIGFVETKRSI